ncbi:hypothetical protein LWF01_11485 [Saxibacter everestensis]|uniref:Uncharacterized protein n=1 Tax=Saxibacter everestensis TaxID=2909229 RepID=A0ABY8QP69_9MICO|nr:hypothetical protein LWF01_11485 [Brevibacteriaceae bacterium ZFBP1038]
MSTKKRRLPIAAHPTLARQKRTADWPRRLPLIISAVLATPLLFLTVRFAFEMGIYATAGLIQDITAGEQWLLSLMVIGPVLTSAATVLFWALAYRHRRASRKATPRTWASLSVVAAGLVPLSWFVLGLNA